MAPRSRYIAGRVGRSEVCWDTSGSVTGLDAVALRARLSSIALAGMGAVFKSALMTALDFVLSNF